MSHKTILMGRVVTTEQVPVRIIGPRIFLSDGSWVNVYTEEQHDVCSNMDIRPIRPDEDEEISLTTPLEDVFSVVLAGIPLECIKFDDAQRESITIEGPKSIVDHFSFGVNTSGVLTLCITKMGLDLLIGQSSQASSSAGAVAVGPGAVAVGAGGVFIGGKNRGVVNTGRIDTCGGAYIGGDVRVEGGNFVGRDWMTSGVSSGFQKSMRPFRILLWLPKLLIPVQILKLKKEF